MSKKVSLICLTIIMALIAGPKIIGPKLATAAGSFQDSSGCADYDPNLEKFVISPRIPRDAYNSGNNNCPKVKPPKPGPDSIKLQRVYDIFSWKSFLAINWPVDPQCQAVDESEYEKKCTKKEITDTSGVPRWATWKESYEVFKVDGTEPAAWGNYRTTIPPTDPPLTSTFEIPDVNTRILYQFNQPVPEVPLWDQNGNMVYYELLMDREEFGNILDDELYNLQGQMDYFASGSPVDFAFGNYGKNIGAVELKLAWKIMAGKDIPSRFFTMDAYVLEENEWVRKTVGLVGMHIAHKTLSSNRWVWSTFEHIDNVRVNDLEAVTLAQEELTLRPSFNNPDCAICPVNTIPQPPLNVTLDAETNKTMTRTQVMREIPIPEAIDELNSQVQALLKAQDSVWQYYELVGTQYITNNNPQLAPAGPGQGLPTSITNESGGFPAPTYLVNSVIETYLQKGNQPASDLVAGSLDADQQIVFGTQSCMGCHYSADIAVARVKDKAFDLPATGDFSFLLGRAQWMKALFDIESTADMIEQLDKEDGLPPELQTRFEKEGVLGPNDKVQIKKDEVIPNKWVITMEQPGQSQKKYIIRKEEDPQSKSDILTAYILQK